jgi:hypothetical protein
MLYRIPRADICMGEAAQFGQRWEARVPVPISKIDDIGLALHSAFSSFRVGDLVNVCAFDDRGWTALTEIGSYRIQSLDHDRIKTVQVGEIVKVPKPKAPGALKPGEKLNVVAVNNCFEVRDPKGNVIETFVDRKQADTFAAKYGASDKAA